MTLRKRLSSDELSSSGGCDQCEERLRSMWAELVVMWAEIVVMWTEVVVMWAGIVVMWAEVEVKVG